jgi:serine/threonine-protein kinase RsbW
MLRPGDTGPQIAVASQLNHVPRRFVVLPPYGLTGGVHISSAQLVCATLEVRVSQIAGEPGTRDFVEVRLPAAGAYLSVLRTATAGLAARLDFTLDEIEDLRIAVDEACAILLQQAVPGSVLSCVFHLIDDALEVTVAAPTTDGRAPERDTFAWTVLSALAGEVGSSVAEDRTVSITLYKERGVGPGQP